MRGGVDRRLRTAIQRRQEDWPFVQERFPPEMPKKEAMNGNATLTKQLFCQECCHAWLDPRERWRVYLTADEPAEPIFYCPTCAAREFDPD